ncbi:helix-turn-helix domain-containing protein [Amnibacterium kyonggiense]
MLDSLLRLQYSAADPVAATAAACAVLGSAAVSARHGALLWEQVSLVDDGVSISLIRSRGDAVHLAIPVATELVVVQVDAGEVTLSSGDHRLVLGEHDLGLIPLGAEADLVWSSAQLQLFSVPAAPLARLLGVPRTAVQLHAPRIDPVGPELGEYLRRTGRLLSSEAFGSPAVYERDLVRAATVELFTAVVVETFGITNRSEDASDRDAGVIRRAIAEMRAHLTEPVTVPEVAASAGVSVRGLQMAFARQLRISPLLHLRQLRLEAARSALVDEATAGTTIAEIARRFGYANSGRFSTHYRNEYGEAPSSTLHRIRSGAEQAARVDATRESAVVAGDPRYDGDPGGRSGREATAATGSDGTA